MATGEQVTDYKPTPSDQASRWQKEITTAKEALKTWHQDGERAVKRYLDERDGTTKHLRRLPLFSANTQVKMAMLYGQMPKVSARRRFADFSDDLGRVAGEMLERHLNSDIEKDGDSYAQVLTYCLEDLLLPTFCLARLRYVAEFEQVPATPAVLDEETGAVVAPEVPATERKSYECVDVDYVPWKGVLWSPCRVPSELRWMSFETLMAREKLVERFGEDIGNKIPLTHNKPDDADKGKADPWGRACVWEIWDKDSRQVVWFVEGFPEVLDTKPDPLGLEDFWPCPAPVIPLATTSAMVPRTGFELCRDLYNTIDALQLRIHLLAEAVRAGGVYNKEAGETVARLLKEAGFNDIVPADNWASFAEKGGVAGVIDWFPTEPIAKAMALLQASQDRAIEQLREVEGIADIMRGVSDPSETARAQGIKARFGSVRLQKLQDQFARFASDIQRLKGEIISKHFDVATIIKASNIEYTPDAHLAMQAAQLLKDKFSHYRIEVKPEAISLTDFAALKQERTEVVAAISQYMTAIAPLAQAAPGIGPGLLQILQWLISGLRGSSQIEGVIDQMVQLAKKQAEAPPQQAPPDPKIVAAQMKLQSEQMKQQGEMAKIQAETQARGVELQLETAAKAQQERAQEESNVREAYKKQLISNAMRPPQMPKPFNGGMP